MTRTSVWIVYKSYDQVEGRGSMLLDKVFYTKELAREYVDAKPGWGIGVD